MEPNKPEPTLEESLKQVVGSLPPVIRDYIAQEKYTPVAQNLMRQYRLRVDQGGVLERELLLLIMGIEDPGQFVEALVTEADIDKDTVDKITRDVNTLIFIPLRAAEMKQAAAKPQAPSDGSHFQLQNKIPLPNRPAPRPAAQPAGPARPGLRSALSQALGTKPFDPAHMLEDHEEPHIDIGKRPAPPAVPLPARTAPPPANLPGQMPMPAAPQVIPPGGRPPAPAAPPPPAPGPAAGAAPAKPAPPPGLTFNAPAKPSSGRYQVDPYREPIDEHEGK